MLKVMCSLLASDYWPHDYSFLTLSVHFSRFKIRWTQTFEAQVRSSYIYLYKNTSSLSLYITLFLSRTHTHTHTRIHKHTQTHLYKEAHANTKRYKTNTRKTEFLTHKNKNMYDAAFCFIVIWLN